MICDLEYNQALIVYLILDQQHIPGPWLAYVIKSLNA